MIRVVIIDDDEVMRHALHQEIKTCTGIECAGSFSSFESAWLAQQPARELGPGVVVVDLAIPAGVDVVILDLTMPAGVDGIEATRTIKTRWPRLKVLILSMREDEQSILNAFTAGADGFLSKTATRKQLGKAIKRVHEGSAALSPFAANVLVHYFRRRQPIMVQLSPTEKIILEAFDRGGTYKEIAGTTGMSINTLKTHAKRILLKSFASSITQAAYFRKQVV